MIRTLQNFWIVLSCLMVLAGGIPAGAEVQIYTDRATWAAQVSTGVIVEDFNGETLGAFTTPYFTVGGCLIDSQVNAIDFNIYEGMNFPTKFIHLRDFGRRASFFFPDIARLYAVGIDYKSNEPWALEIDDGNVVGVHHLVVGVVSFIGVVDTEGVVPYFHLTGPTHVSGGISLDNLSFNANPVQVKGLSWGRVKALYD